MRFFIAMILLIIVLGSKAQHDAETRKVAQAAK